jgi:hypothetical protein
MLDRLCELLAAVSLVRDREVHRGEGRESARLADYSMSLVLPEMTWRGPSVVEAAVTGECCRPADPAEPRGGSVDPVTDTEGMPVTALSALSIRPRGNGRCDPFAGLAGRGRLGEKVGGQRFNPFPRKAVLLTAPPKHASSRGGSCGAGRLPVSFRTGPQGFLGLSSLRTDHPIGTS